MPKKDMKQFLNHNAAKQQLVEADQIVAKGDWILKWTPKAKPDKSGFELFTPPEFDENATSLPLGGVILAAVYFLLEHGDESFAQELINKANKLSDEIGANDNVNQPRTLN